MAKFDVIGTVLPLAAVAGVAYFAITYGPALADTIFQSIQGAMGGGAMMSGAPVTASGSTAGICTTGNPQLDQTLTQMGMNICQATGQQGTGSPTGTCTTGNPQLDQMLTSMGMNVCSYTQAGGQGPLNSGIPGAFPSAINNTGGFPGLIPGITNPRYGTTTQFPQFTGAPQFMAAPIGTPNCAGGICRSYVGEVLNGW